MIKVILFGATGNLGRRILRQGLNSGLHITAFVRNKEKLMQQIGQALPDNLAVIEGDIFDEQAVGSAIEGNNTLINTAGVVSDGERFYDLCQIIMGQAEKQLSGPKKVWFLAGAAALDFGSPGIMAVDLPVIPKIFQNHKKNYLSLMKTDLDWSLMCPGPMVESENDKLTKHLRISTDVMPFDYPSWLLKGPKVGLSLTMKKYLPETIVSYSDVADIIINNLEEKGQYSYKRIGVALPKGIKGKKENMMPVSK
ncbi:MAG: NAD(P)H-binding protein [Oleispira sp.]|nr:NAD(P)H-binding protein [Oleispira sp.]